MISKYLPENCIQIISGGAKGIDALAEEVARQKCIPFLRFEPAYQLYGKSAPLLRNEEIVRNADLVLAFWDCRSRGTANTIDACIRLGVEFRIIHLEKSPL